MPRFIKFLLFLLSVVLTTGCVTKKATSTIPSIADEYAVYKVVIESLYFSEGFPLVVLKNHTALDTSPGESLDNVISYIQENLGSAIESETLNDFRTKNRQSQELDAGLFDTRYVLLSQAKFNEIFKQSGSWSKFYITYANSQGVMTLSSVGFNTKMDQALLYVGNQSDYLAGRGHYIFLTKKGEWTIQTMIVAWVS